MAPPRSKAELETRLGMVTNLSKFAPRLSETIAPLRQLLKENSEFMWDSNQDAAFHQIKDLITQEPGPVLTYFDHAKEVRLQVDASKCGLGAVLLQGEKLVALALKTLNETEENYAQIEKELYAVLFGCRRFHQYLYGRQVIVESDHKPLESIMRKRFAAAPPRLERTILQLQRYDITWKPGKQIPVADTLSRKPIECLDNSLSEGMDLQIRTVISSAPVNDRKMAEIKAATAQDEQLSMYVTVLARDVQTDRGTSRILQHLPRATQLQHKGTNALASYPGTTLANSSHKCVHLAQ
uniref:Reverse transcriptase RNase H-like domain-containing protein n=1 Tax=Gasterosteus aculeatus aculeatus TaxID=481459 RepID=A0AAQ4QML5_GASAC